MSPWWYVMTDPESDLSTAEDEAAFWALPVERRAIVVLWDIMLSIRDLPQFACDESPLNVNAYWFPARLGCLDAFLAVMSSQVGRGSVTTRSDVVDG
jgi:hypothetical protein